MSNLVNTKVLLSSFYLFMGAYSLDAAKLVYESITEVEQNHAIIRFPKDERKLLVDGYCRVYGIPEELASLICYFVPIEYSNKPLPRDFSNQDLSGCDFTGCQFMYTNLTNTNLGNTVLDNTTCNYQKLFEYNLNEKECKGSDWSWYGHLTEDLASIAHLYSKLKDNNYKVRLLKVSCGLSRLPLDEVEEFNVRLHYWSCEWLQLKRELVQYSDQKLVCSQEITLNLDAYVECWVTDYPTHKVKLYEKEPHVSFDQYLQEFNQGLKQHCQPQTERGFLWYRENIQKGITELKNVYSKIKNEQLQKEACDIASALGKSYQVEKMPLLLHYLFCQNRLISLKKSIGVEGKNLYYNYSLYKLDNRV